MNLLTRALYCTCRNSRARIRVHRFIARNAPCLLQHPKYSLEFTKLFIYKIRATDTGARKRRRIEEGIYSHVQYCSHYNALNSNVPLVNQISFLVFTRGNGLRGNRFCLFRRPARMNEYNKHSSFL